MTEKESDEMMKKIAEELKEKIPENMGFALLAYEFGEGADKKMLYISNTNRIDVMNIMAEFLENNLDLLKDEEGKDVSL